MPKKECKAKTFGNEGDLFELNDVLDSGTQGEVYVCTRRKTGIKHAVKRVDVNSMELRRNAGKVRVNLMREITCMRELYHENIINLIEQFWHDDESVCFIVMDLARGGTLHDKLVPGSGLGFEDGTVFVGKQLLAGMGYMHSRNVIHRDMKPANILIHDQVKQESLEPKSPKHGKQKSSTDQRKVFYKVKIADFGLSKLLNQPGGVRNDMTKVGTPAFAAPEIVTSNTYDEKADFFSFGCILFTMYCGEYPFDEQPEYIKNPKAAKVEILPCPAWEKVSARAKEVIHGLLTPDPAQRYDLNSCYKHPLFAEAVDPIALRKQAEFRDRASTRADSKEPFARKSSRGAGDFSAWCLQGLVAAMMGGSASGENADEVDNQVLDVGAVQRIKGWSGSAVDSIEMALVNGERKSYGGEGGTDFQEWQLKPDECIMAVSQERLGNGYLGNAFVFFTTKHRSIPVLGQNAANRNRFVSPVGFQVVGLMFENSRLTGVIIEKTPTAKGIAKGLVKSITSSQGYAVDMIKFALKSGEERSYGDEATGDVKKTWELEPNETIVIVEQNYRDFLLGNSMNFYTSLGKVHSVRGISATQSLRYMASGDDQICGLAFKDGALTHVHTCSRSNPGELAEVKTQKIDKDLRSDGVESNAKSVVNGIRSPQRSGLSDRSSPKAPWEER